MMMKIIEFLNLLAQKSLTSGAGSQSTGGRRRGFGGFAASVQPPAVVLALPPISVTQPKSELDSTSVVQTPGLVIPQIGKTEQMV